MDLTVVLDTNAYCDWRGTGCWHDWLAKADRVLVPAVVIGELIHGFRKGREFPKNTASTSALGSSGVSKPLGFDSDVLF